MRKKGGYLVMDTADLLLSTNANTFQLRSQLPAARDAKCGLRIVHRHGFRVDLLAREEKSRCGTLQVFKVTGELFATWD